MRALIQCRFYQFGSHFLFQKCGIPIGGPVSGAVLDCVLSVQENSFDKFIWPRLAHQLGLKGCRGKWLTITRYVDDVFVISKWFCPTCVKNMIPKIYRGVVKFDCCNDGATKIQNYNVVKFLDLWIFCEWAKTEIFLVNKNDLFAFSGLPSLKTKMCRTHLSTSHRKVIVSKTMKKGNQLVIVSLVSRKLANV